MYDINIYRNYYTTYIRARLLIATWPNRIHKGHYRTSLIILDISAFLIRLTRGVFLIVTIIVFSGMYRSAYHQCSNQTHSSVNWRGVPKWCGRKPYTCARLHKGQVTEPSVNPWSTAWSVHLDSNANNNSTFHTEWRLRRLGRFAYQASETAEIVAGFVPPQPQ